MPLSKWTLASLNCKAIHLILFLHWLLTKLWKVVVSSLDLNLLDRFENGVHMASINLRFSVKAVYILPLLSTARGPVVMDYRKGQYTWMTSVIWRLMSSSTLQADNVRKDSSLPINLGQFIFSAVFRCSHSMRNNMLFIIYKIQCKPIENWMEIELMTTKVVCSYPTSSPLT